MLLKKAISVPLSREAQFSLLQRLIKRIFEACPNCLNVYIFGSAAQLQMTDTSDLDVLVLMENEKELKAAKENYYRSGTKLSCPVDILFLSSSRFDQLSQMGGVVSECKTKGIRFDKSDYLAHKPIQAFFKL